MTGSDSPAEPTRWTVDETVAYAKRHWTDTESNDLIELVIARLVEGIESMNASAVSPEAQAVIDAAVKCHEALNRYGVGVVNIDEMNAAIAAEGAAVAAYLASVDTEATTDE